MARMKPGRRDLFALIMSPKRTITAALFVVFILSVTEVPELKLLLEEIYFSKSTTRAG